MFIIVFLSLNIVSCILLGKSACNLFIIDNSSIAFSGGFFAMEIMLLQSMSSDLF